MSSLRGERWFVLLDVPAPTGDLDEEFPGAMGWRNPWHLDYVAADRQLARHPPSLGNIPLRIVTATDGQSNVKDQSFWLDLSSRAEQTTLEGGHDLFPRTLPGSSRRFN
jgi:hypothetical protein